MKVLDEEQVQAVLEFLRFHCTFAPEGNHKQRQARHKEIVRRSVRILLAEKDDPLMVRIMGMK